MIWVFDSWFWWLQTLKYLKAQFPHEDFLFLADNKNIPYGNKDELTIRNLTVKNITWLLDQWCQYIVIACNTAVASIYHHWFSEEIENKLIGVTKCGIKEAILYNHKKIAVLCTQATHNLNVYPTIYEEVQGKWLLYTIPAPELVPLIEADTLDYDKIYHYVDMYGKYIAADTDCLILGCTHYPIILDVFWEKFPYLKIIDPGRSTIFTLDKRISSKDSKKDYGRGHIRLVCTGSSEKFIKWAQKIRKTKDLPPIEEVSI